MNEEISDIDYNLTVKIVRHKLWPVSYIDDNGVQVDTVWNFKPSGDEFHVGEACFFELIHPKDLPQEERAAKIARIESELEVLRNA